MRTRFVPPSSFNRFYILALSQNHVMSDGVRIRMQLRGAHRAPRGAQPARMRRCREIRLRLDSASASGFRTLSPSRRRAVGPSTARRRASCSDARKSGVPSPQTSTPRGRRRKRSPSLGPRVMSVTSAGGCAPASGPGGSTSKRRRMVARKVTASSSASL